MPPPPAYKVISQKDITK